MGDTQVGLLAVAQVRLEDEDVAHGQHTQASNLLGTVEDDRREPAGHLTVQPNLDTLQITITVLSHHDISKKTESNLT